MRQALYCAFKRGLEMRKKGGVQAKIVLHYVTRPYREGKEAKMTPRKKSRGRGEFDPWYLTSRSTVR